MWGLIWRLFDMFKQQFSTIEKATDWGNNNFLWVYWKREFNITHNIGVLYKNDYWQVEPLLSYKSITVKHYV